MSERCETDKTPQAKANATDKFNSIARHNQRHCLFDNAATTNQAIFSAIFNSLLGLALANVCVCFAQSDHDYFADSELSTQLDRAFGIKQVGDLALSPDGKNVAYAVDGSIYVSRSDASNERTLAEGSKAAWSPDGRSLAYLSGSDSNRQIWIISATGENKRQLTTSDEYIDSFNWAPDGVKIGFLSRPRDWAKLTYLANSNVDGVPTIVDENNVPRNRLSILSIESNEVKSLTSDKFSVGGYNQWFPDTFSFSPDSKTIAFSQRPNAKAGGHLDSEVATVSLDSGSLQVLTDRPGMDAYPQYSPDGNQIAFLTTETHDWVTGSHIYLLDLRTSRLEKLTGAVDRKIAEFSWSHDGKTIYFILNDGVTSPIYSLDVKSRTVDKFSGDQKVYRSLSVAFDSSALAFLRESANESPQVYVTSSTKFRPKQITSLNQSVSDWPKFETEVVSWRSYDGMEIQGILHKPVGYTNGQSVPLLVTPHGGPHGVDQNKFATPLVRVFAERGWAIFRPNFRGSGGYGEAFLRADIKNWGIGDYEDQMSGVDFLVASGIADPERLAIAGVSYGGYMSSWTISQTDRFKAAVIGAPITDTVSFVRTLDAPDRFRDYLGNDPRNYQRHSPLYYGDRMKTPTLIWHGHGDIRVPVMQSRALYVTLKKYGVPTRYLLYRGEPHGLHRPDHQRDLLIRQVAWIEDWTSL